MDWCGSTEDSLVIQGSDALESMVAQSDELVASDLEVCLCGGPSSSIEAEPLIALVAYEPWADARYESIQLLEGDGSIESHMDAQDFERYLTKAKVDIRVLFERHRKCYDGLSAVCFDLFGVASDFEWYRTFLSDEGTLDKNDHFLGWYFVCAYLCA